jgi:hypothetical protein
MESPCEAYGFKLAFEVGFLVLSGSATAAETPTLAQTMGIIPLAPFMPKNFTHQPSKLHSGFNLF